MKFNFQEGIKKIKKSVNVCPKGPGIYQFIDKNNKVLYIGKAKKLSNRIRSYLNFNTQSNRIKKMIGLVDKVKFIKTHTEVDALILESNLIKDVKPTFNIRLIDDKTFPFILINQSSEWSRIQKYRGAKNQKGFYFGPFANVQSLEKTITILEKGFLIRSCSDSEFQNRKRPCLLYQIKRCSAPCVDLIDKETYNNLVEQAISFLKGKNKKLKTALITRMEQASKNQDYEKAVIFRDRIQAITKISQEQYSILNDKNDFDIISSIKKNDLVCINVFFFRNGRNLGNKEYFFENQKEKSAELIMEEFIGLFYIKNPNPRLVILNKKIKNKELIEEAISTNRGTNLKIIFPKKGKKSDLIKMTENNISNSIEKFVNNSKDSNELISELSKTFKLNTVPKRIEIYDNSHLQGTNPVGAMVVYKNYQFFREGYRIFNIKTDKKVMMDDYSMMNQTIDRRFTIEKGKSSWKSELPDLIIVDGGRGHLNVIKNLMNAKSFNIDIIAIAKGKKRNAGNETIYFNNKSFNLEKNNKILYFLQRLRDEAHRFAISNQKYRRKMNVKNSIFDNIYGIGSKTKKNLLSYFGSIDNIKTAGIRDLENVSGVGKAMAIKIYKEFNE